MKILKNNYQTKDPRLTRVPQFDERSKTFSIKDTIMTDVPRSYTWQCSTHLDQGNEGACVGFAFAHELIAKPSVIPNIDAKFAREKIYWEAQKNDDWPGGEYPTATPVYEGTSVLAGVKTIQKLGFIKEYRWAFGLNDLILAVGHKGPAVLGVNWYESMFDPYECGFLHVEGEVSGGHAILCKGVNVSEKYFILHNSWGPTWGQNGDAKISFNEMEKLLSEDGEAVIPTIRSISIGQKIAKLFASMFKTPIA